MPPVIDGGEIILPNYHGGVLIALARGIWLNQWGGKCVPRIFNLFETQDECISLQLHSSFSLRIVRAGHVKKPKVVSNELPNLL
jgi:hypothetical protein